MERESKLPQQVPSSASSSPPRDLLRHVQAAFKRSRPLTGNMASNVSRARRVLVPEVESRKIASSANLSGTSAFGEKLRINVGRDPGGQNAAEPVQEDSICTPLSITGTRVSTLDESNVTSDVGHRATSATDAQLDSKVEGFQPGLVDDAKKVQFSLAATLGSIGPTAHSQESESAVGIQVGQASRNIKHDLKQREFQHTQMSDTSSVRSGVTQMLAKKDDFLVHPVNQSASSFSCAVTASVHSMSAPMLNSTTYNSCSNMDVETDEEFNLKPRPTPQGDVVTPLCPKFQPTGVSSTRQSAVSTLVSGSAPGASLGTQDHSLSKGQGSVLKETDPSKAAELDDKSSKEKVQISVVDYDNRQSQAQSVKVPPSSSSIDTAQVNKTEKSASARGMSVPRKKNYDPDVFFKVNRKLYQKLGKIGSGGSSEVHKVISSDCTIYALKKIKLKGRDYSTAYGFYQEIEYLNKLKGKNNIIQLVDYEVTDKRLLEEITHGSINAKDARIREDGYIYMVLEYGEIDLAHMLSQKWKDMDSSSCQIDENWLRFYWQQMLLAVNTIHEERIVHSDLKPANFLLVRGSLKLIDFGIAKAIMSDTTNIQRDSQVGTLNYMSPEAFMWNEQDASGNTIKCGRPSDIWSLGCILYQMVYGRTPFADYKTFWAKFKVITDRNHEIKYDPVSNPWLLHLMKKCLSWDRSDRWRIPQLLQHPFLVPLVPPQLPLSRDEHCKLLMEMAEIYRNNPQVSSLCSQLQSVLTNLTGDYIL
ncbi:serine/threonine-protein kinase MPS1 isoform X2 [Aristolochia californica]|uniref:serine/threonine-protein kinase MPS1 isoform X2 n=1 Tax=Aristolochia californica TaxID=171875 RepID=UPI0035DBF526